MCTRITLITARWSAKMDGWLDWLCCTVLYVQSSAYYPERQNNVPLLKSLVHTYLPTYLCNEFTIGLMRFSNSSSACDVSASPSSPLRKRKRFLHDGEIEVDVDAPEPPSKKALRKARKGKIAKLPAQINQSKSSDSQSYQISLSGTHSQKRSTSGIWMGNLPWSLTKADVQMFLTSNTGISEDTITRIHMPVSKDATNADSRQDKKPQNKGFAYIDFSTESALAQAIALSETLLGGRRVLVKDSKDFDGRPKKRREEDGVAVARSGKSPSKRIFIGNLGFETSEADLREHFSRCGRILDVHVATFEDSGKCKGYAWVDFEDLEAGEAAVKGWVYSDKANDNKNSPKIGESSDDENNRAHPKSKRSLRKWWVNKLKGRPLRMEFAEDKTTRYNKRFGKDGTGRKGSSSIPIISEDSAIAIHKIKGPSASIDNENRADSQVAPAQSRARSGSKPSMKKTGSRKMADLAAGSPLKRGLVAGVGKKTTFL